MNLNNFTIKAQEAVQGAEQMAQSYNHPQIENAHILKALFKLLDKTFLFTPSLLFGEWYYSYF